MSKTTKIIQKLQLDYQKVLHSHNIIMQLNLFKNTYIITYSCKAFHSLTNRTPRIRYIILNICSRFYIVIHNSSQRAWNNEMLYTTEVIIATRTKRISNWSRILWVQIKILQQNGLTKSWLVVKTRASFTMTTGSNLEEERAVHSAHKTYN